MGKEQTDITELRLSQNLVTNAMLMIDVDKDIAPSDYISELQLAVKTLLYLIGFAQQEEVETGQSRRLTIIACKLALDFISKMLDLNDCGGKRIDRIKFKQRNDITELKALPLNARIETVNIQFINEANHSESLAKLCIPINPADAVIVRKALKDSGIIRYIFFGIAESEGDWEISHYIDCWTQWFLSQRRKLS